MMKKISTLLLISAFVLISGFFLNPANATSSHSGQIVKMNGLSSLYYVASDGKRYVFPNEKIYKSWFVNFDDVVTLSQENLTSLPLGGNVLYRPGVILVKITTDPKVYAVSQGGTLRWVKTEVSAKALYGDKWNMLIDDIPDSFFTNYQIGKEIVNSSDFDPQGEADSTDNIDSNHDLSSTNALKASTRKCQIINNDRDCGSKNNGTPANSDDTKAPYITDINIANRGQKGYIDNNDEISISFNEAIDPASINPELEIDDEFASLDDDITGAVSIESDGLLTIKNIAAFDLGAVDDVGQFAVRLKLNINAKILTITILSGEGIAINDEDFEDAKQIGGTVKDAAGNIMEEDPDIGTPDGSFGGVNTNDGIEPYITAIKVYNNGSDDMIDIGDEIQITFSEEIDAESINHSLDKNSSVSGVDANDTGGVIVSKNGLLTITNIASFFVGDVADSELYDVSLSLNSTGMILAITLTSGDDLALENEDLDNAEQIGETVEDKDGNEMDDDPNIDDPIGSFIGESAGSSLYVSFIKAYNNGYDGYIDVDDKIVITFSQEIDPGSMDGSNYINYRETGGVSVDASGLLTITDILSFDMGEVASAEQFEVGLAMSNSNKVMTITIQDGNPIKINSEIFSKATQFGGFIQDASGDTIMETEYNIDAPEGTFGGDSADSPPYITGIKVENHGQAGYINTNDKIILTFNEALNPDSVNNNLELDDYVSNIDDNDTGGIYVKDDGTLTITDIAEFNVGDVADDTSFDVKLALNDIGNVLTITLEDGNEVEINYQDLDLAEQTGGTLEDTDGEVMEADPRIDDPTGSF